MKSAVILISGRGSNMQALVEAKPGLDFRAVISNRPAAAGLAWARARGLATRVVDHKALRLARGLRRGARAGRRRLRARLPLPRGLHAHPHRRASSTATRAASSTSTPRCCPCFPGLDTHRRALEAGVKLHGATVHFVTPALDHGPILVQAAVPVLGGGHRGDAGRARARAGAPHLSAGGALARRGARGIRGRRCRPGPGLGR